MPGPIPASMRTRAKTVDGGFLLNGSKTWITNSPIADVLVVWAKDDAGDIRGFILERGMAGLTQPKIEGKFSPARLGHRHDHDAGRVRPGREHAAGGEGAARAVLLPEQRALRHRLGRAGRGRVLLARGARATRCSG